MGDQAACKIDDCSRRIKAKGLCSPHYQKLRKYGDPEVSKRASHRPEACAIEGCGKRVSARGWCNAHYKKWEKYGDPLAVCEKPPSPERCSIEGCDEPPSARGWCRAHYGQWHKTGDPLHRSQSPRLGRPCAIEGCPREPYSRLHCRRHHTNLKRWGDPLGRPDDGGKVEPAENAGLRAAGAICRELGCARTPKARGMCDGHYRQWVTAGGLGRACGEPSCDRFAVARGLCTLHYSYWREGPGKSLVRPFGDVVSNSSAHQRCTALWGSVRQYPCINCGEQAREWAYDGTDPTQLYEKSGTGSWLFYSVYPEFYMPMCIKCHRRRDNALVKSQLHGIRSLMHETGFTLAEIRESVMERCGLLENGAENG